MEAWRRALDEPVRAFPIEKAGPAHIATLKTFDPPLSALEGRRLAGAERRGKRLLFPTEDGELVLLVHLMTAGRLRYLVAGGKGPKSPAFRLRFEGGAQLVLTEAGSKKRAGVWLLTPEAADEELAHLAPAASGPGAFRPYPLTPRPPGRAASRLVSTSLGSSLASRRPRRSTRRRRPRCSTCSPLLVADTRATRPSFGSDSRRT